MIPIIIGALKTVLNGVEKKMGKAEWLNDTKINYQELEKFLGRNTSRFVANSKVLGHDRIHGFWLIKYTSIHD